MKVYFAPATALARLDLSHAPPPPADTCFECSPLPPPDLREPGFCSTAGRKDLRLESTGAPWPLVHLPLGPADWKPTWGAYLKRCGEAVGEAAGLTCFSIDGRQDDHVQWLAGQGLQPGAVCRLHTLRVPWGPRPAAWVHLSTAEI